MPISGIMIAGAVFLFKKSKAGFVLLTSPLAIGVEVGFVMITEFGILNVPGLVAGVLAFVMFLVVLFTGKYPRAIHDFQVGTLRWALWVAAYMSMMTDKCPPFSGKN